MDNFREIQILLSPSQVYMKNPETFKGLRKEANPKWEGWARIDELNSRATPIAAIGNDGKLLSSASNYQFELYTSLGLGGKPFELELAIMTIAFSYGKPLVERILKDMDPTLNSPKEFWLVFYTKMKNIMERRALLDMIPLEVIKYV